MRLQKILDIYADWAKEITGLDIPMKWCTDFGCYPQDEDDYLVEIGMLATEFSCIDLPDFLQNNFKCDFLLSDIQFYVICFLHEIGHIQTWDMLTPDQQKKETTTDPHQYRRLPTEFAADDWAIAYINANLERVFDHWQPLLEQAYEEVTEKDLKNFLKTA